MIRSWTAVWVGVFYLRGDLALGQLGKITRGTNTPRALSGVHLRLWAGRVYPVRSRDTQRVWWYGGDEPASEAP
jgi:hypothetical protein